MQSLSKNNVPPITSNEKSQPNSTAEFGQVKPLPAYAAQQAAAPPQLPDKYHTVVQAPGVTLGAAFHRPAAPYRPINPAELGLGASNLEPQQTLYLRNLNDKIKKKDMKTALYMLCSVYGIVIGIVLLKTPKMRGQAHIAFADVSHSIAALRALQGFIFFDKPIKVEFAKSKSHVISKLDGTFSVPLLSININPATAHQGIKRRREDEES